MIRGLYTAASGALVAQSMADTVANNLANASSGGFKQTLLQVQSAPTMDIYRIQTDPSQSANGSNIGTSVSQPVGTLGTGASIYDTPVDFTQGPLQSTGNRLDVGITGQNAFFSVLTPNGVRYTRNGQFTLDSNANLTTMDGNLVLDTNGRPLHFNTQQGTATIEPNGLVIQDAQAGQTASTVTQVGTIALTSFGNLTALRKEGDNNLVDTGNAGAAPAQGASLEQGFLEQSNQNVVRSMVDLIVSNRWFDANERMMKAQDDATSQDINGVAKT